MFRHILVPVDGSEQALATVPVALDLARSAGGEVVFAAGVPSRDGSCRWRDVDAAHVYLQRAAALAHHAGVWSREVLLHGDPAEQLVSYAAGNGIDLIVMAPSTCSADHGVLADDVTDAIVRTSPVPVLVSQSTTPGIDVDGASHHVLVALDGSRLAERVLPAALALARQVDASVTLLQVIDAAGTFSGGDTVAQQITVRELRAAYAYLVAVRERWAGAGIPIEISVRLGRPDETVAWVAYELAAGTVAVSPHWRDGQDDRVDDLVRSLREHGLAAQLLVSGAAVVAPAGAGEDAVPKGLKPMRAA